MKVSKNVCRARSYLSSEDFMVAVKLKEIRMVRNSAVVDNRLSVVFAVRFHCR